MISEYTQLYSRFNSDDHLELLDRNKVQTFFDQSVICGHLEIAQWLYKVGADIHSNNDQAFRYSCHYGYLDIAKWLHGLGVNIHSNNDQVFRNSCLNGYFYIAKWL